MSHAESPVIFCAIDTPDIDHAQKLISDVASVGCGIKLGLEFFNSFGPQGIERALTAAPDAKLFLDFKYHDIPNTVAGAIRSICHHFSPMYLNVHAGGGQAMMEAAKNATLKTSSQTRLLAVTILTSLDDVQIRDVGYKDGAGATVMKMVEVTKKSGCDGVVCSSHEVETIRSVYKDDFALMVPGIRPAGSNSGDQKRIMTPSQAVHLGATHLVIGRPITQAASPGDAASAILKSVS